MGKLTGLPTELRQKPTTAHAQMCARSDGPWLPRESPSHSFQVQDKELGGVSCESRGTMEREGGPTLPFWEAVPGPKSTLSHPSAQPRAQQLVQQRARRQGGHPQGWQFHDKLPLAPPGRHSLLLPRGQRLAEPVPAASTLRVGGSYN